MASPNSAFTTMVTTFGLAGIVGKHDTVQNLNTDDKRQTCNDAW